MQLLIIGMVQLFSIFLDGDLLTIILFQHTMVELFFLNKRAIYLLKRTLLQCLITMMPINMRSYLLAIYVFFEENSSTLFNYNTADEHVGAIFVVVINTYSSISFAETMFSDNIVDRNGAICIISFEGDSSTMFSNNIAYHGRAMYLCL